MASQLACFPQQASQVTLLNQEGELQRGPPETLVAILKFPIREELVMGGREGWALVHPQLCATEASDHGHGGLCI